MPLTKVQAGLLEATGTPSAGTFLRGDGSWSGTLVSGTAITLTNQAAPTASNIPSWVKRVTLMLSQVSTNGTSTLGVRLGTSGGIDSGSTYIYLNHVLGATGVDRYSNASGGTYPTIFSITASSSYTAANLIYSGQIVFSLIDTNLWVVSGAVSTGNIAGSLYTYLTTGTKSLASALTQIQLTTFGGIDQFDAGIVNILYEG